MASYKTVKISATIIAGLVWFAIILQMYLSMQAYLSQGRTVGGALVEFFTYFTIQCNLLAAICLTAVATGPFSKTFFSRPGVLTAAAVYISIVCLVYNLVLRGLAHPQNWGRVADELLHVVDPLAFILFWVMAVPKQHIKWQDAFSWLWYPFLYLVYALIRGAVAAIYPYFFLDAIKFGYGKVFLNIAVLMLVFLAFSMLYVFISRLLSRKATS